VNQKNSGRNKEGYRSRESLAGRGYALTIDGFGVKASVLSIDCMIMPGLKGRGRISLLGIVGKSTHDSARIGLNMLRPYCSRLADSDTKVLFGTPAGVGDTSVSGASAGQAILLTMISAIIQEPFDADVCATGTVDINGRAGLVGASSPRRVLLS
jgi:ATP-dependent Lon protease